MDFRLECALGLTGGAGGGQDPARDRALAALATEFDRRLATIATRDRTELQRILLALLEPGVEG